MTTKARSLTTQSCLIRTFDLGAAGWAAPGSMCHLWRTFCAALTPELLAS